MIDLFIDEEDEVLEVSDSLGDEILDVRASDPVDNTVPSGRSAAAEAVLENIPVKNAEWYYLHGIIQLRRGAYDAARAELERAATMDPTNAEYRNAYESLARSSRGYAYRPNAAGSMNSVCTTCQALWAADCCCECLGGDFIRCI